MPTSECWPIFVAGLNHIRFEYGFTTHLFVLMSNHYHLIGTCSEHHNLGEVMAWLQKYVSRTINSRAGRINHVFGGSYKASLIRDPLHYSAVYKYVARNPVVAGMCEQVDEYLFLSMNKMTMPRVLTSSAPHWSALIPEDPKELYGWLEQEHAEETLKTIRKGLRNPIFQAFDRSRRRPAILTRPRYQKEVRTD